MTCLAAESAIRPLATDVSSYPAAVVQPGDWGSSSSAESSVPWFPSQPVPVYEDVVELRRHLRQLPEAARADLIRVLASPSDVRADVIRQFHQRGREDMAELLMMCEEDDLKRVALLSELRGM